MTRVPMRSALVLVLVAACSGTTSDNPNKYFDTTEQPVVPCQQGPLVPGIDVSHYQGNVNWSQVYSTGIRWAYAKATEGSGACHHFVDPAFAQNWSGMKAAGVLRGGYHFFRSSCDGTAQADLYLATVGQMGQSTDLPPMLDWESSDSGSSDAQAVTNAAAFIAEIKNKTGLNTIIYTDAGFWKSLSGTSQFKSSPLWNANWQSSSPAHSVMPSAGLCPSPLSPWNGFVMWQWYDNGSVANISGGVDMDAFNGTLVQLQQLAGQQAPPPPMCPHGDGTYCSGDGYAGTANTLYQCTAGTFTVAQSCAYGCTASPPGGHDQCASPPPPAMCPSGDGTYCSGNGYAGTANTLYQCTSGTFTVAQTCSYGCTAGTPGGHDQCASPPPPPMCPNGDGTYCSGDGYTGTASTLYQCTAGTFTVAQSCAYGCTAAPPGGHDQCASPPMCPNGDGTYCGGDGHTGSAGTLYQCTGGTFTVEQACSYGCTASPPGGHDQCAPPPPPMCPNGDGTYCSGNGYTGTANTLYQCTSGSFTVAQSCAYGCSATAPGGHDQCASAPPPAPPGPVAQQSGNDAITLVNWTDAHMDLFAKTPGGAELHTSTTGTGDTWSTPSQLDVGAACGSAAAFWGGSWTYPELFSPLSNGSTGHLWWSSSGWKTYHVFGGMNLSHFSTTITKDGRAAAFALGSDGAIWTNFWDTSVSNWSGWTSLGGSFVTGAGAITWGNGTVEIFATNSAGVAQHMWSDMTGTANWSGWSTLGSGVATRPVPVRWTDGKAGHAEVFARGTDGQLYHSEFSYATDWPGFTVVSPGTQIAGEPSALMGSAGPEVFARDPSGNVLHLARSGTGYTQFTALGSQVAASDPFGWTRGDGNAEVFAIDASGNLVHNYRDPTNGWTGWSTIASGFDPCAGP